MTDTTRAISRAALAAACELIELCPTTHFAYKVVDPEGDEVWLCAHDVRRSGGLSRGA